MKPFLSGRATSPVKPLAAHRVARPPARAATTPPAAASAGGQVEVVKEGDKVTRLIVTCACGERIEIDCLYPAHG
jgi:hypothetical protein